MSGLSIQTLFFIFGSAMILLLVIAVLAGMFTILMLHDCFQRDFPKKNIWLGSIIIFNIIGALIYYVQVKENRTKFIKQKAKQKVRK